MQNYKLLEEYREKNLCDFVFGSNFWWWDTTSMIHEKKIIIVPLLKKLKTSAVYKTLLRDWKNKTQFWKKYLQKPLLINDCYLKYKIEHDEICLALMLN